VGDPIYIMGNPEVDRQCGTYRESDLKGMSWRPIVSITRLAAPHFLLNRVRCVITQRHLPLSLTNTSVARSLVVNSCPMNLPLVVVSAVTRAVFP